MATSVASVVLLLIAGGCATRIEKAGPEYRGLLRRPDSILVQDFAFSPDQVSPEGAIGALSTSW